LSSARHGKPPVKVELRHDGSELVLTVTDCGPGIPAPDRERVFTPFTRLDGKTRGTGLGLSLVRQIARLHGGDAGVASQPDAASSFCVTLRTDNPATFHQKPKQRSA
jgi:signal transduction histidine kinase